MPTDMSTTQALLAKLQDRDKNGVHDSLHLVLTELLSMCRCGNGKHEILDTGLDALLALPRDISAINSDTLALLLELLVSLGADNCRGQAKIAQRGGVALALECIDTFLERKPTTMRHRILTLALTLLELLGSAEETMAPEVQERIITTLFRVLDNSDEDNSLLLLATNLLGCSFEARKENIHFVVKIGGITTYLRRLEMSNTSAKLRKMICVSLLVMGQDSAMLQVMVSSGIVHSLCMCLRDKHLSCDFERVVIQLFARLSEETQVYGQMIIEELPSLLFRSIDRNSNVIDIPSTACTILNGVAQFARKCKLDLAQYFMDPACQGNILIRTAMSHTHDVKVVQSIFHFFVNISYNPADLPQIVNSETIEGLLCLYITGANGAHRSTMAKNLVDIISLLSRSTVEALSIQDQDRTLPSLFVCLRGYRENVKFVSHIFAILAKVVKTKIKSPHCITSFIGIAIDLLCRQSAFWSIEKVELCNFLREVLLLKDGDKVVLGFDGKILLEILRRQLFSLKQQQNHDITNNLVVNSYQQSSLTLSSSIGVWILPYAEKIVTALVRILEHVVEKIVPVYTVPLAAKASHSTSHLSPRTNLKQFQNADIAYEEYVTALLRRENTWPCKSLDDSSLPTAIDDISLGDSFDTTVQQVDDDVTRCSSIPCPAHGSISDAGVCNYDGIRCETVDDQECERTIKVSSDSSKQRKQKESGMEYTEDASDDPGDDSNEDDDDNDITASGNTEHGETSFSIFEAKATVGTDSPGESSNISSRKQITARESAEIDLAHCQDKQYYYLSFSGVKFPKHPSKGAGFDDGDKELITDAPLITEPCQPPNLDMIVSFVEQKKIKRNQFLNSDTRSRAKVAYDSSSPIRDGPHTRDALCESSSINWPYDVTINSDAFQDSKSNLTFDSDFESGNLACAIQIGEYEYDLLLRSDIYTTGHMQWFYFAVSNVETTSYRFNIINLCKPDSLFNQGLQPVIYSVKDAKEKQRGWFRGGTDIFYFSNVFSRTSTNNGKRATTIDDTEVCSQNATANTSKTYYTLTFTLSFPNSDDTYLVAHSYPYTTANHRLHISRLLETSGHCIDSILRHRILCTTVGGRNCDLLTISDFATGEQEIKARKAVVITSRVHPGEPQSSWMMRGIIDFLTSNAEKARVLRRMFVFHVIPLLNLDGVYFGNNRCGLSACDLNRQWQNPSKTLHPTIFHAKELIINEISTRGVAFFCDIHGHSRKKNVFMYGCDTKKKPNPRARAFVKLFSTQDIGKNYISYPDCSFKVSKDKATTARAVVANELKVGWSFTLEASFCGASFGPFRGMHFNTKHLQEAGGALCVALFEGCIHDASVREQLIAVADNYSICIPKYIDKYLREIGEINDEMGPSCANSSVKSRKGSTGSFRSPSKQVCRQDSNQRQSSDHGGLDERKQINTTSAIPDFGKIPRKKRQSSRRLIASNDSTVRRNIQAEHLPSPPMVASTLSRSEHCADASNSKATVKDIKTTKTRKKSLSRRRDSPQTGGITQNGESIMPKKSERHRDSIGDTNRKLIVSVGSSTLVSATTKPLHSTMGSSKISVFSLPALTRPSPQSSDAVGRNFPPLITELVTRSPAVKLCGVRFRGGGRQYAAVSSPDSGAKVTMMRTNSIDSISTYERDLLNASRMTIQNRRNTTLSDITSQSQLSDGDESRYRNIPTINWPRRAQEKHIS